MHDNPPALWGSRNLKLDSSSLRMSLWGTQIIKPTERCHNFSHLCSMMKAQQCNLKCTKHVPLPILCVWTDPNTQRSCNSLRKKRKEKKPNQNECLNLPKPPNQHSEATHVPTNSQPLPLPTFPNLTRTSHKRTPLARRPAPLIFSVLKGWRMRSLGIWRVQEPGTEFVPKELEVKEKYNHS